MTTRFRTLLVGALLALSVTSLATAAEVVPTPADPIDAMTPAQAKRELAARRTTALARLQAYRSRGVFPRNRVTRGMANVFMDENGYLCAMATLIQASGRQDLVDQIAGDNNLIRMGETTSGPLYDWMLRSGLTVEEIALVQMPDMRMPEPAPVTWLPEENARIKGHILMVVNRLKKDTRISLTIAARRLQAAKQKT
jgi:hypothetical protein